MGRENKSIQYTRDDWISITDAKKKNPLCENHSDVLRNGFHDANINGIDFKSVAKYKFDNSEYDYIDPSEYSAKKSFLVESEDWDGVVEEFKKQLGVEKVRISYLARMVISNYRMRLIKQESQEPEIKVSTKTLDGVEILQQVNNYAAKLIKRGEVKRVLDFINETWQED